MHCLSTITRINNPNKTKSTCYNIEREQNILTEVTKVLVDYMALIGDRLKDDDVTSLASSVEYWKSKRDYTGRLKEVVKVLITNKTEEK